MNKIQNIKCDGCGATLKFKPGTNHLSCEYCGHNIHIDQTESNNTNIQEFDIDNYISEIFDKESEDEVTTVVCDSCSAETTLGDDFASKECPFCSAPLVIQRAKIKRMHRPQYILPFAVDEREAFKAFQTWVKSLWFAPNALTQYAVKGEKLQGIYLPYWTYDCSTISRYDGELGKVNVKPGASNKVSWYSVSGIVYDQFDDVLVPATRSLPKNKLEALEPWDLDNLKPYDSQFLTGFKTENYQITLRKGYSDAKKKMIQVIRQHIKKDIGGSRQKIGRVYTQYENTTFKHILLPCWVSAYRFKGITYQFLVNARTGEVQGGRPYSLVKISLFIWVWL